MPHNIRYTLLSLRDLLASIGPFALLTLLLLALAYWWLDPNPPKRVVLATGPAQSAYDEFGKRYAQALSRYGITVELLPSQGSSANLELLRTGKADLGFVQGGSADIGYDDEEAITSLGSLFVEPLWLFYREDSAVRLKQSPTIRSLSDLVGWRVNVGTPGSGVPRLFSTLLDVNRIDRQQLQLSELEQTPATVAFLEGPDRCPGVRVGAGVADGADAAAITGCPVAGLRPERGLLAPLWVSHAGGDAPGRGRPLEKHSRPRHALGRFHHQPAGRSQDPPCDPAAVRSVGDPPAQRRQLVQPRPRIPQPGTQRGYRFRRRRCARSRTGRRSCSAICRSGWPTWSSACGWRWV